eukprot:SM013373S27068  [mRNA]  locus=s13373:101:271:+ [translate_table: standard]
MSPGFSLKSSECAWPFLCSGPLPSRFTCAQGALWLQPAASVRATSIRLLAILLCIY